MLRRHEPAPSVAHDGTHRRDGCGERVRLEDEEHEPAQGGVSEGGGAGVGEGGWVGEGEKDLFAGRLPSARTSHWTLARAP